MQPRVIRLKDATDYSGMDINKFNKDIRPHISVFVIPKEFVKNEYDRLVVLNQTAKEVVESVRGEHPVYVFTYKGQPLSRINNKAWRKARKETGLSHVGALLDTANLYLIPANLPQGFCK